MSALSTAQTVARSTWLESLTRAGFVGYGITHLLLAWVAVQIATRQPAGVADQSGALRLLVGGTLGRWLVVLIAIGFAAMALWQALLAVAGHREFRGRRRWLEKAASVGRTLLYVYLGWTAWKVFKGVAAGGDAQQRQAVDLMNRPNGTAMVLAAGAVMALFGVGLAVYGWRQWFRHHLRTAEMSARERKVSEVLGVVGYLAKGVAYGVAGVLLMIAATSYDPAKARGLDAALRGLAEQPDGRSLLIVVAVGLAAFAAFCFVQARYRKV